MEFKGEHCFYWLGHSTRWFSGVLFNSPFMLFPSNGAGIMANQAFSETALSVFFGMFLPAFTGFS